MLITISFSPNKRQQTHLKLVFLNTHDFKLLSDVPLNVQQEHLPKVSPESQELEQTGHTLITNMLLEKNTLADEYQELNK